MAIFLIQRVLAGLPERLVRRLDEVTELMRGGAAFVAFKRTKQPALADKFLDFLAQDAN